MGSTNRVSKVIKHRVLVLQAASCKQRRETRLQAMTTEERQALEALRDPPTNPPNIAEDSDDFNLGDIWDGTDALPISHAGGEFRDLARGVLGEVWKLKDQDGAHRVQRVDNRTRRDRVLRRNLAFNEQIQIMSESYLIWSLEKSQKGFKSFYDRLRSEETEVTDLNGGQWPVTVVDAFCGIPSATSHINFQLHLTYIFKSDGLWPRSSTNPSDATRLTGASNMHCPACTYTLTDEEKLHFKILYAMDGNDSLKRILRRSLDDDDDSLGLSSELPTGQSSLHRIRHVIREPIHGAERGACKYPLAIVAKLLDAFGDDLGGNWYRRSGDFVFHRQQAIDSYFEHNDELEVYGNLSLEIIANGEAVLPKVMQELKVEDESVFECWLEDEKIYLKGLTREPEEETLQMEYWQRLVNLSASKVALDAGMNMFGTHNTPSYGADIGNTRKVESTRRHALEDYERNLKLVQLLECKLGIIARWVPEDEEWQKAGRLVWSWLAFFELAKMNRAGTGYKLRKHIARALQTRSARHQCPPSTHTTTLPVRCTLPGKYSSGRMLSSTPFLADFELLRKTRSDVSQLPWSSPAARSGMDLYFKCVEHARRFVVLNIEVRCLVTYIRDEDKYLRVCEDRLTVANPCPCPSIAIHRNIRGRFNSRHIKRLNDISKLPGFNGTLVPGLSACTGIGESASMPDPLIPANVFAAHIPAHNPSSPIGADTQEDLDEEEIAEEVAEEASRSLQDIITITADFSQLQVVDNGEVEE
ncbi:hypothetical protein DFJ58DRAFT_839350 [Suillus subalutaceus]|uniref:uncharacterized protein n=1 Tax=Suillus subalutaceus TaxID=48586 RepID=UPI001B86D5A2|nr:uncharacterized protein DFJ58DRAFT_839350 [Suillus subalutaceus]KAG1862841.1 hypothetical protein DFJ58DRAFT_839350 [Suillus subalutaceus]